MNQRSFVLTLDELNDNAKVKYSEEISGGSLEEVLSKLPLFIHRITSLQAKKECDERVNKLLDDDIPF